MRIRTRGPCSLHVTLAHKTSRGRDIYMYIYIYIYICTYIYYVIVCLYMMTAQKVLKKKVASLPCYHLSVQNQHIFQWEAVSLVHVPPYTQGQLKEIIWACIYIYTYMYICIDSYKHTKHKAQTMWNWGNEVHAHTKVNRSIYSQSHACWNSAPWRIQEQIRPWRSGSWSGKSL